MHLYDDFGFVGKFMARANVMVPIMEDRDGNGKGLPRGHFI